MKLVFLQLLILPIIHQSCTLLGSYGVDVTSRDCGTGAQAWGYPVGLGRLKREGNVLWAETKKHVFVPVKILRIAVAYSSVVRGKEARVQFPRKV